GEVVGGDREVEDERKRGEDRRRQGERRGAYSFGHCCRAHPSTLRPNRPPGRSTSTSTSMTKPTAVVRYDGRTRIANDSTTATISAAIAMPKMLPRPPRTTTTNALSSSLEPVLGLKAKIVAARRPARPASAVPMPNVRL